jgi:ERCC4-type nuclease
VNTSEAAAEEVLFSRAVLIDHREKAPYSFTGFTTDVRQGNKPLRVLTRLADLPSGDYSLAGLLEEVAVERKSLQDLFYTLGQHRDRFERELTRLSRMTFAAVVVEAEWSTILQRPPEASRLPPKVVFRSVLAWQQEFPNVHWWFTPGRRPAEVVTFRIMERFARRGHEQRQKKNQPSKNGDKEEKHEPKKMIPAMAEG